MDEGIEQTESKSGQDLVVVPAETTVLDAGQASWR